MWSLHKQLIQYALYFSPAEEASIILANENLRGKKQDIVTSFNIGDLIEFLTPLHQEMLPRILATSLFYCGRYEDTQVTVSSADPNCRTLLVSLANFPGSDPSAGHTPCGKPCPRLDILYHWDNTKIGNPVTHQQDLWSRNNARKYLFKYSLK